MRDGCIDLFVIFEVVFGLGANELGVVVQDGRFGSAGRGVFGGGGVIAEVEFVLGDGDESGRTDCLGRRRFNRLPFGDRPQQGGDQENGQPAERFIEAGPDNLLLTSARRLERPSGSTLNEDNPPSKEQS